MPPEDDDIAIPPANAEELKRARRHRHILFGLTILLILLPLGAAFWKLFIEE